MPSWVRSGEYFGYLPEESNVDISDGTDDIEKLDIVLLAHPRILREDNSFDPNDLHLGIVERVEGEAVWVSHLSYERDSAATEMLDALYEIGYELVAARRVV